MQRRTLLGAAVGAAAMGLGGQAMAAAAPPRRKLKQGLWRINFGADTKLSFDQQCAYAKSIGCHGFDVIAPADWPTLRKHGLEPLLVRPDGIDFLTGLVHAEVHDKVVSELGKLADYCKANGAKLIAANAGERRGLSFSQCADNAVAVCKRLAPHLEAAGVTLCIENVNDRRADPDLGRKDMAFGHWDWGVEVVKRVGSPRVKILCDFYHLQIMDGDVASYFLRDLDAIAHCHVAGVPSRKEIDGSQEVNFRYLAEVIATSGYDGYVCHEWRPTPGRDPLKSIAEMVRLMDV
jgi:hydroxypyruvate isomerase